MPPEPEVEAARWLPADTFAGEVALVTGGGTGLGLEIARGLCALGATVAIASRSPEHHTALLDEARERGWKAEAHILDLREAPSVRSTVATLLERHGKLDLLVNNAAGNFVCPAERLSANAWRAVLGIVLDGTFYATKHAGKAMIAAQKGVILNVVATYASGGMPGVVHSASAKAGVLSMTKTLAGEWARHGIRVNAIAPGPFQSDGAAANLWPDPKVEARIAASIPLGRFATRDEVAAHALWLLSPASAYVSGENFVIDGGLTAGASRFFEPGERVERRPRVARGDD